MLSPGPLLGITATEGVLAFLHRTRSKRFVCNRKMDLLSEAYYSRYRPRTRLVASFWPSSSAKVKRLVRFCCANGSATDRALATHRSKIEDSTGSWCWNMLTKYTSVWETSTKPATIGNASCSFEHSASRWLVRKSSSKNTLCRANLAAHAAALFVDSYLWGWTRRFSQ